MNRELLTKLRDALLSPEILPDFPFHMANPESCVLGFYNKLTGTPIANVCRELTGMGSQHDSPHWCWFFGMGWYKTDNTRIGAAKRITYYLEHGFPEDWEKQKAGLAPLCY